MIPSARQSGCLLTIILSGCGPMVVNHPAPTTPISATQLVVPHPPLTMPISAAQPTEVCAHRISVLHARSTVLSIPNFITGSTVARLDLGQQWGDLGLSLGTLGTNAFSAIVGVDVGRSLYHGDRISLGVVGRLGTGVIDSSYTEFIEEEDGTTTSIERSRYYSSIAPGAAVRGVLYPSDWLGLAGTIGGSYSAVWMWGEGSGPRELWLEGTAGVLVGRQDGLQLGAAWQPIFLARLDQMVHLSLSLNR